MTASISEFKKFALGLNYNKSINQYFAISIICLFFFACTFKTPVNHNIVTAQSKDGSSIAYGVRGQGETTLLFIHGWLCDHTVWQHQISYFSKNYRVVWIDLAGHGNSDANRQRFSMAAFAQDVKSVIDQIGGENFILVGHSMGGPIVIETAKLLGEKVIGIVGVDAFYTPLASVPEKIKMTFLEKLKKDYPNALAETVSSMFTKKTSPELIDLSYHTMLAVDQTIGISALYECIKWNSEKEPSELIHFANKLYNINGAQTNNEKALHESVVLISGAGHFVSRIKPNEFNAALDLIIEKFEHYLKTKHH